MLNWFRSLLRSGLSIAVAILLSAIIVTVAFTMQDRYTMLKVSGDSAPALALVKYDSLTGRCWIIVVVHDYVEIREIRNQKSREVAD